MNDSHHIVFPTSHTVTQLSPSAVSPFPTLDEIFLRRRSIPARGRGRRGRPAKSRPATRFGATEISTVVGASSSGVPPLSSSRLEISDPSSQVVQSGPQPPNGVKTRACRALALGATVGVVLDCPEEEALAGLCEQISSHLHNL